MDAQESLGAIAPEGIPMNENQIDMVLLLASFALLEIANLLTAVGIRN
jgi:hypothetical protein